MLGSTMEEGTVVAWRKQEGDAVGQGEVLLEVMTDKASMEIESPEDGVLRRILAAEDSTVPVQQPLAVIATATELSRGLSRQRLRPLTARRLARRRRARRDRSAIRRAGATLSRPARAGWRSERESTSRYWRPRAAARVANHRTGRGRLEGRAARRRAAPDTGVARVTPLAAETRRGSGSGPERSRPRTSWKPRAPRRCASACRAIRTGTRAGATGSRLAARSPAASCRGERSRFRIQRATCGL